MLFVWSLFLAGCVKERWTDELSGELSLKIQAVDSRGEDITCSGALNDVLIYQYNGGNRYVASVAMDAVEIRNRGEVAMQVVPNEFYQFIGIANTRNKGLFAFNPLCNARDNRLVIHPDSLGNARFGTDLFYGYTEVTGRKAVLTMHRALSQMHVTVWYKNAESDKDSYRVVVAGGKNRGIDFYGYPVSGASACRYSAFLKPGPLSDARGVLYAETETFQVFPALADDASYSVELYRNDELVCRTSEDSEGKKLVPKAGERYNVLLDLRTLKSIEISVRVSDWNEHHLWYAW